MPEYPPECDVANGTTIDIRHNIPENGALDTYEIYEQPFGETNLCKHKLKYTADSYASAVSALDAIRNKSLHLDTYMAVRMLEKTPEKVTSGTWYPARYYMRRRNEAVYKIIRTWRGYDEDTASWCDKTSSETHYNYSAALAALNQTREYIVKYRLRIQAELKLVAGVIYPHERGVPMIDAPLGASNGVSNGADVPMMTRSAFLAIVAEIRRRGINATINEDLGIIALDANTPQDVLDELAAMRDRLNEEDERVGMPAHAVALINEIRRRELPVTITQDNDQLLFRVSDTVTREQHHEIDRLITEYRRAHNADITPLPTFNVNMRPIDYSGVFARAHRRLRQYLSTVPPLGIRVVITDKEVRVHVDEPHRIHKYVEKIRKILCFDEGAAQVQRERDAFAQMQHIIQVNHGVTVVDNHNNTLTLTGVMSQQSREVIKLIIKQFIKRRSTGFMDEEKPIIANTPEQTTADLQTLLNEINRRGIPVNIVAADHGSTIESGTGITREQVTELRQLIRDYEQRGNIAFHEVRPGCTDPQCTHTAQQHTRTGHRAPTPTPTPAPTRTPALNDLPVTTSALDMINRRVFNRWLTMARNSGIDVTLNTAADGTITPVYGAGVNALHQSFTELMREAVRQREMERISRCEIEELDAVIGALREHGIPVSVERDSQNEYDIIVENNTTEAQRLLIHRAMEVYKLRHSQGFPPIEETTAEEVVDEYHRSTHASNAPVDVPLSTPNGTSPEMTPEQAQKLIQELTAMFARES